MADNVDGNSSRLRGVSGRSSPSNPRAGETLTEVSESWGLSAAFDNELSDQVGFEVPHSINKW